MTARLVILGLPRERPLYGYELKKVIEEHMGDWTAIVRDGLVAAIQEVAAGRTPVDPAVAGKLFAHVVQAAPIPKTAIAADLSERERDVLRLLAHGLSNAGIAGRLYLSEGTVRNYISTILAKLGVTERTQAVVLAPRHGLVEE